MNTHFRTFHKPMGIAVQGNRLAIGGQKIVWELHNMPALARKLEPVGKYDAFFALLRNWVARMHRAMPAPPTSSRWPRR